jgi:hypothetical protein
MPIWNPLRSKPQIDQLFVFIHLPKCAGTSLLRTLSMVGHKHCCTVAENPTKTEVLADLQRQMTERQIQPDQLHLIMGRDTFHGIHRVGSKQPFYFTFLRDPVDRYISQYRFYVDCIKDPSHKGFAMARERIVTEGRLLSLAEYTDLKRGSNLITKVLANANTDESGTDRFWSIKEKEAREPALELIDKLSFIGFVDSYSEDVRTICQCVGIVPKVNRVNASAARVKIDEELRQKIERLNWLDREIFEVAKAKAVKLRSGQVSS